MHLFGAAFPHSLEARLGDQQPGIDALGVDLEMKLDAPGVRPFPKRLHLDVITRGQQLGAVRQVERIFMPLEDSVSTVKRPEQRIHLARFRDPHRLESELAERCPVDTRIEGASQHLAAQADAKHR